MINCVQLVLSGHSIATSVMNDTFHIKFSNDQSSVSVKSRHRGYKVV